RVRLELAAVVVRRPRAVTARTPSLGLAGLVVLGRLQGLLARPVGMVPSAAQRFFAAGRRARLMFVLPLRLLLLAPARVAAGSLAVAQPRSGLLFGAAQRRARRRAGCQSTDRGTG